MTKLLPCPFCGCPDLHGFEFHEGDVSFGFQCMKCWMTGPQFATKDEAVAAWNSRAPALDEPTRDLLEAWAFNVMLECSATLPDEGKIAIGGAVLSLHDLNTVLKAVACPTPLPSGSIER